MSLLDKRRAAKAPAPVKPRDGSSLGPVIDREGNIRFLSVSQLEKFDSTVYGGCERRWWFRYVKREKEPQKSFAKVGDQCHAQAEHYLRTGEDVLGEIIRAGKRFLPRPGSDLLVEVKFGQLAWPGPVAAPVVSELMAGGVPLTGKADLMHCRGEWVDDDGTIRPEADPNTAETLDHKTTKQINNVVDPLTERIISQGYAKTAIELAGTWQMLGYGELAWQRWQHIRNVRLGHAYYQSKGQRAASKRSIVLPIDLVREKWSRADGLVARMKVVAKASRVEDVAPNYEACSSYGGCPHRQKCPRDVGKLLADMFGGKADALRSKTAAAVAEEGNLMSLLEKRRAAMAAGNAAPVAPVADLKNEIAALEAEERALRAGSSITPPDMPAPSKIAEPHPPGSVHAAATKPMNINVECRCGHTVPIDQTSTLPDGVSVHIGCTKVAEEEAAKLSKPFTMTVIPPVPIAPPASACPVGATQVELTTDEAIGKKRTCSCGAVTKVKPAKLGDGKYYALVPKHDVPGAPNVETPATPPTAPPPAPPVVPTVAIKPDVTVEVKSAVDSIGSYALPAPTVDLYLDASEDGVALQRLETYAEKVAGVLCEKYQAADVRCAPKESPLGFGGWKGAIAALAKAEPPVPGAYVVSSSSEIAMVVFEALAPLKIGRVVRRGA